MISKSLEISQLWIIRLASFDISNPDSVGVRLILEIWSILNFYFISPKIKLTRLVPWRIDRFNFAFVGNFTFNCHIRNSLNVRFFIANTNIYIFTGFFDSNPCSDRMIRFHSKSRMDMIFVSLSNCRRRTLNRPWTQQPNVCQTYRSWNRLCIACKTCTRGFS